MGEGACQLDIVNRARWGRELTSETIPISIANPQPQLHSEVPNVFSMYVRMGEYKEENAKHLFA